MRSGGLKDRVTILKKTVAVDAIGHPVETWTALGQVWGELQQEKGSEVLQNDRPVAFKRAILFLRYRNDVTVQNKVTVGSTTWEIESVRVLDRTRRDEGLELILRAND